MIGGADDGPGANDQRAAVYTYLRHLATREKARRTCRRMLAIANALDGISRAYAVAEDHYRPFEKRALFPERMISFDPEPP